MILGKLFGVFLAGAVVCQGDNDGSYSGVMVGELSEEPNYFRPHTARDVMRYAALMAKREKSAERVKYGILRGNDLAGPMRVQVVDVVQLTTPTYNYPHTQRMRRFQNAKSSERVKPVVEKQDEDNDQSPKIRPRFSRKFEPRRSSHRSRGGDRNRFRKPKWTREKREIITGGGRDFDLSPMSNEEVIKKKKKKKKKKKITTTEGPDAKRIKKVAAKKRLYQESEEIDMSKVKGQGVVKDMSKDLERLMREFAKSEEFTAPPRLFPTKAKFVPVPTNWQNPPTWRPPTAGTQRVFHRRGHHSRSDIVTIAPESNNKEDEGPTTEFDWRSYTHPLKPAENVGEQLELKPAPSDWPLPTHPPDGIYDWHKSQFKRAPRTRRPFKSYSGYPHTGTGDNNQQHHQQYAGIRWTQPTHTLQWNRFPRMGGRLNNNYVPYTTQRWNWARPAEEETAMFQRNDMWKTVPWSAKSNAVAETDPYKAELIRAEREHLQGKGRFHVSSNLKFTEDIHLTTGPPLTALNEPLLEMDLPSQVQEKVTPPGGEAHQVNQQYSYNYGPQHSSWQSYTHGQQKGEHGQSQYQSYQNYYGNLSNYHSHYYQNYRSHTANKSSAIHYEQGHHYEDNHVASGHYQSHYFYQGQGQTQGQAQVQGHVQGHVQHQGHPQPQLRPPAYFHNVIDEVRSTNEPMDEKASGQNHVAPTLGVAFRLPNEYAGNDRDLRAPLPTRGVFDPPPKDQYYPTRSWSSSRYRRPLGPLQRGYRLRIRRAGGVRPTGYRSIFTAPLQRGTWNGTGVQLITPKIL